MRAMPDDVLTTSEAAAEANVAPSTLRRWVKEGLLPSEQTLGGHFRIRRQDLLRALGRERELS